MIFPAKRGTKWGLLDMSGTFVVAPKFDCLGDYSSGLVSGELDGNVGFLDESGTEIIPFQFNSEPHRMPEFREGLAAVRKGEVTGYIDVRGQWVIPPSWYRGWDFVGGRALAESIDGYFVINRSGEIISRINAEEVPFYIKWPQNWSHIRCLLEVDGKLLTSFVDWNGQVVFPPRFRWMTDFWGDVALFCEQEDDSINPWGMVSTSGVILKDPRYFRISGFCDGVARAATSQKNVGFIDVHGEWVIQPMYRQATPFSEGLACVTVKGKKGFINLLGELVIEPRFDRESMFHGGVAEVYYEGKRAYISKSGRIIWQE